MFFWKQGFYSSGWPRAPRDLPALGAMTKSVCNHTWHSYTLYKPDY